METLKELKKEIDWLRKEYLAALEIIDQLIELITKHKKG